MDDIVKKMLERINLKIDIMQSNFKGWDGAHERRMAEITGMLDMLSIVTGKEYILTDNGLEVREINN